MNIMLNTGPVAERAINIHAKLNSRLRLFQRTLTGARPEPTLLGVEGARFIEDALRSGLQPESLLVSPSGTSALDRVLHAVRSDGTNIAQIPIIRTSDSIFRKISATESPQGVAGLFRVPAWDFDDLLRGPSRTVSLGVESTVNTPLILVLTEVQDPGNVGTIVRSAEAFGASGVVATRGTADPWAPKALRASAGSALRLPLISGIAVPALIAQLRLRKIKIFATASGSNDFSSGLKCVSESPAAIFIGNEGAGLSGEALKAADSILSIPLARTVESLNAGVAASILLYEISRIRSKAQ